MLNCKVLLVDDERDFLAALGKRLGKRGVIVTEAHTGEEAVARMAENPADVVVLDMKMPGMGGMRTLQEIKRVHPFVEVIMLTGHASLDSAIQGLECGAFDYVMKPMDFDKLFHRIQDAYTRKSLREERGAASAVSDDTMGKEVE